MTTRTRAVAAAFVLSLLVVGCSTSGADDSARAQPAWTKPLVEVAQNPTPTLPVTVESSDGRRVTVTDVSRIVTLWVNISEVVYSLGLGDNVVGRDITTTFDEADGVPLVTRAHDVSAEGVLSLEPTLVLADTETGPPEALDAIRSAGDPGGGVPARVSRRRDPARHRADRGRGRASRGGPDPRGPDAVGPHRGASLRSRRARSRNGSRSSTCAAPPACTCSAARGRAPTR